MSWIFACKLLMKKLIQCCRISILIWYCETRYHDILLSLIFSYAPNVDVSVQRTWKLNTVKLNYSTKLLHELHCCSCYSWSVYALEQHRLYHKAIKCFLISRSPHKMTWWATLHPRAFSFTHAVKQKLLHVVSKESEFLNIGIVIDSLLPLSQSLEELLLTSNMTSLVFGVFVKVQT